MSEHQLTPGDHTESEYKLPECIVDYIAAYNALDIPGLLACLTDDVVFRNFSDGTLTATAQGKPEFEKLARAGAALFSARKQRVRKVSCTGSEIVVEIEFTATVAQDMPNGWRAGQRVDLTGCSIFETKNGKICALTDKA